MNAKRDDAQLELEGRVRDVTDGGECVVETDRGIVLVQGGLPGERVRVRVHEKRGGVARGALVSVLSTSADRVAASCAIADRCGGCPLMSLALTAQHALKREHVARAVAKVIAPDVEIELRVGADALAYRRRARLAFRKRGGASVLGYHAHGSTQLVDVERCPVLEPALEAALDRVRSGLLPALSGQGVLELSSLDAGQVSVSVTCEAAVAAEAYRAAEALAYHAPIAAVALRVGDGAPAQFGVATQLPTASDGLPLRAPPHGFSQVNASVNARLRALVLELAEPESARVLELYAGYGNFTLGLSQRAGELLAVESDRAAAQACGENLRARGRARARVLAGDVRQLKVRGRWDVIVLDPPRGGCTNLAEIAAQAKPSRVVYVSCHMTTLSRDLQALHAAGYEADRVSALDMFPQTGHVEAVVRMRKIAS